MKTTLEQLRAQTEYSKKLDMMGAELKDLAKCHPECRRCLARLAEIKAFLNGPSPFTPDPEAFNPFERTDQADEPTERMEIPMFNPSTELDPNPDNPELVETH